MKPSPIRLLLITTICPLLASAQTIYKRDDKFEGKTEYYTHDQQAKLEGGSYFSLRYVDFSLHTVTSLASAPKPYWLMVKTNTPEWVFIPAGASLALKLDGSTILKLSGEGSKDHREVLDANSLLEIAAYPLSVEDLQKIGQAKLVEFRIYGDKQEITGTVPPKFLEETALFAQQGPGLLGIAAGSGIDVAASNASPNSPSTLAAQSGKPVHFGAHFVNASSFMAGGSKPPDKKGASVLTVEPKSVAENAGVKPNDVIRQYNGTPVQQANDLISLVLKTTTGQAVPIVIWRDGSESTIEAQF